MASAKERRRLRREARGQIDGELEIESFELDQMESDLPFDDTFEDSQAWLFGRPNTIKLPTAKRFRKPGLTTVISKTLSVLKWVLALVIILAGIFLIVKIALPETAKSDSYSQPQIYDTPTLIEAEGASFVVAQIKDRDRFWIEGSSYFWRIYPDPQIHYVLDENGQTTLRENQHPDNVVAISSSNEIHYYELEEHEEPLQIRIPYAEGAAIHVARFQSGGMGFGTGIFLVVLMMVSIFGIIVILLSFPENT